MLDGVLMACARIDCRTRLVGECWTNYVCVERSREDYGGLWWEVLEAGAASVIGMVGTVRCCCRARRDDQSYVGGSALGDDQVQMIAGEGVWLGDVLLEGVQRIAV